MSISVAKPYHQDSNEEFIPILKKVFGMPEGCRKFTITFEADCPILIDCEYYPDHGTLDFNTCVVRKKYEMKVVDEETLNERSQKEKDDNPF